MAITDSLKKYLLRLLLRQGLGNNYDSAPKRMLTKGQKRFLKREGILTFNCGGTEFQAQPYDANTISVTWSNMRHCYSKKEINELRCFEGMRRYVLFKTCVARSRVQELLGVAVDVKNHNGYVFFGAIV
jgi:hypothetical protein